jgi:membrane-bound metal-dependent hydrolase YbcI (DUF457 family)
MDRQSHRRAHLGVGTIAALGLWYTNTLTDFQITIGWIIFTQLYWLPDIDTKFSWMNHRGYSHTFLVSGLLTGGLWWMITQTQNLIISFGEVTFIQAETWAVVMSGAVGLSHLTHILEDMLTAGGGFKIKPLEPMSSASVSITGLTYDHPILRAFSLFLIVLSLILFSFMIGVFEMKPIVDNLSRLIPPV